jgi:hypothetical protein
VTLAPGIGLVKKARFRACARDDSTFGGSGPPVVAYRFETLERIVNPWQSAEIDALMPWNHRTRTASASGLLPRKQNPKLTVMIAIPGIVAR